MIFENNLSPVLLELGPLEVRWYGLMFAAGILLSYMIVRWVFKREKFKVDDLDSLLVYLFVGLVVGARLGHVFFYNAGYFLANPVEILMIWKGGLASHGAAIGLVLMYWIWTRVHKVSFGKYVDSLMIGIPVTAACVRIGNFFNSEIVGKMTGGDFGVVFARLGESFPRHPSQLYEAALNLAIFVIFLVAYKRIGSMKKVKSGSFLLAYLVMYFGGRFVLEFWKDLKGPLPADFPFTMGQVLSLVAVVIALIGFAFLKKGRS